MPKTKNIIVQEEEFLKLNAEIDSKTKELLSQVEFIKEIQLDNDKLYSELQQSCPNISNNDLKQGVEKEEKSQIERSNSSSEVNYSLTDYLSKIRDEISDPANLDSAESLKLNSKDSGAKKYSFRKNLKLSQSARVSASISTTTLGQEINFPLGVTRTRLNGKLINNEVNEIIPDTLKEVSHDGITRFLSAKVKLLTEQLEMVQKDGKKQLDKIKELQMDKNKLEEEKEKLIQQANTTRNAFLKCDQHLNNLSTQLKSTQAENANLKKELEVVKKELRESSKNHSANELRLNRTLEEVDKLKSTLQQMKQEEKELKENNRRKIDELSTAMKKLDRQRIELLNGFKKQLLIIDNLKRQKELIDANKLLKCVEEDFINFLDSNPPSVIRQTHSISSRS